MKFVIAPDSFKESLSAMEVARAIEAGLLKALPDAKTTLIPVADGGEGTVEALSAATAGAIHHRRVTGPLGEAVEGFFGLSGDGQLAMIEMAAAAGLMLVPENRRDPRKTTTAGVGELIRYALDAGARDFVIGIGGSATNDGGAGMLTALGVALLDGAGSPIAPGGGALARLERIDISGLDPRLSNCRIQVACDVDNPLTGPEGAAAVFGPQKGATAAMVRELDDNLAHYAKILARDLGTEVTNIPGAGAAGGLGAAFLAVLNCRLRPGIDIVMETVALDAAVRDADLVITGEGCIDGQTIHGKTPIGVARVAKRHGKPVLALAGCLGEGYEAVYGHGIDAVFGILPRPCPLEGALSEARDNLERTARSIAALAGIWAVG